MVSSKDISTVFQLETILWMHLLASLHLCLVKCKVYSVWFIFSDVSHNRNIGRQAKCTPNACSYSGFIQKSDNSNQSNDRNEALCKINRFFPKPVCIANSNTSNLFSHLCVYNGHIPNLCIIIFNRKATIMI